MVDPFLNFDNLAYLEEMVRRYQEDPTSVDPSWKAFLDGYALGQASGQDGGGEELASYRLTQAFRHFGHLAAADNPLAESPAMPPFLTAAFWGCSSSDLEQRLKNLYCGPIGFEFEGFCEPEVIAWLVKQIESEGAKDPSNEERVAILQLLERAEQLETFLHTRYVGQKRFSLEGAEVLIPLLAFLLDQAASDGVEQSVLGMAHRGRLNVLCNILGKSPHLIFHEFEDHYLERTDLGTGDVKYHKGFFGESTSLSGRKLQLWLAANPSHLEAVDPVAMGMARALEERRKEGARHLMPILIHGDAAVAGQGVVYETLEMSRLEGYSVGGTVHLVVNNQIGFTTLPKDARSTRYCTDIAKSFGSPVFHLNGEDPEACIRVARLAAGLRQRFGCDPFIDILCYRKYGHNEGDEPRFTQPIEYAGIAGRPSVRALYRQRLEALGLSLPPASDQFAKELEEAHASAKIPPDPPLAPPRQPLPVNAFPLQIEALRQLGREITTFAAGFKPHSKVKRLFEDRRKMVEGDEESRLVDWGMGELLAWSSLLKEGIGVRLSGQDSRRGTFSQRHALCVDETSGTYDYPLSRLSGASGRFEAYNSPLSEYAVMGFEFGYSTLAERTQVVWEAQFGDFVNTAQVVIDQFLASSFEKWGHASALVLLLPHGYEGQGPEHSSARIERFLQLCAQENMVVANPSSPAQHFHLLRRHALGKVRRPLVIFTPKALLRAPACTSSLKDLAAGQFVTILPGPAPAKSPRRMLLCSGKIYYELLEHREKLKKEDVALLRIEQLYPLDLPTLQQEIARYPSIDELVWVQEEPKNMGAFSYMAQHLKDLLYAGRPATAATAVGSYSVHVKELKELLENAFKESR